MGHRTLKRVSLDFNWPIKTTWKGYINPHPGPMNCEKCDCTGYNALTKQIDDEFYGRDRPGTRWCNMITQDEVQALIDHDRLFDFTHTWSPEVGWVRRADGYIPTAAEVNRWSKQGFGHDSLNRMFLVEARAKRVGVWGKCETCGGSGEIPQPDPAVRKLHDEWQEYEPPAGEGYQLWETTSDGSPVSPVFSSASKLAEWCEHGATIFGAERLTRQQWFEMFVAEDPASAVDVGSLMVGNGDYLGSIANMPQ